MISRVISKYDLKSIGLFNIVGKKILSDESARALSNEIRLNVLDLKSQSAKLSKDLFKKISLGGKKLIKTKFTSKIVIKNWKKLIHP